MGEKMHLDLSPFVRNSDSVDNLCQVADHMEKFSGVERVGRIVSCYRAPQDSPYGPRFVINHDPLYGINCRRPIQDYLPWLFFPVWMLLGLIPKEEGKRLTVGNVAVAQLEQKDKFDFSWVEFQLKNYGISIGQGQLCIEHLTVVCENSNLSNIDALKAELSRIGNITFGSCKVKVIHINTFFSPLDLEAYLERLHAVISAGHELKIMIGEVFLSGHKLNIDSAVLARIPSDWFEDDELAAEITKLEDIYESPHTMFGSCYALYGIPLSALSYNSMTGDGILIATLGHGCTPKMKKAASNYEMKEAQLSILDQKNFTNETAPTFNMFYTNPWIIDDYTKTSSFVICQTTYCNGTIANGATAKAIQWLTENWKKDWKERYDNLVVLIPYGGQYMEDEMIEINRASSEGIVIVCAAGTSGRGVVFPAALGTVLSVGIDDVGASGREIDIHVPKSSLTNEWQRRQPEILGHFSIISGAAFPVDCSIAATRITGLLSLFLSRINSILRSKHLNPICQQMADCIRKKDQYLHTCVIRELLVNEGNGSHDPLLGYGDGEKIFDCLIKCETGFLLAKMSRVLLKKSGKEIKVIKPNNNPEDNRFRLIPISEDTREDDYHSLTGSDVKVAVIDQEFPPNSDNQCTGKKEYHGEMCSKVIENIAPNAKVKPILDAGAIVPSLNECKDDSFVSVVSCSMGTESFDLQVFKAVNEAVIAGKILVFSAGNRGQKSRNAILYPGRIGSVLVIGGQDPFNSHLSFSSVGKEIDFLAPAEYGGHKGTSYAAPAIAGHIALLLEFVKRMSDEDYRIIAWSRSSNSDKYKWLEISIWKAVHNVYAMRNLLKLFVTKPQPHSEISGFGCIDFSVLFPSYRVRPDIDVTSFIAAQAKEQIHKRLQFFYCRRPNSVMINVYSLDTLFSNMHI